MAAGTSFGNPDGEEAVDGAKEGDELATPVEPGAGPADAPGQAPSALQPGGSPAPSANKGAEVGAVEEETLPSQGEGAPGSLVRTTSPEAPPAPEASHAGSQSHLSQKRGSLVSEAPEVRLFIIQGEVCDLVPDITGDPIRLEVKETFEVLWNEDQHPQSQLKALLDSGKEISHELYDKGSFAREVVRRRDKLLELVGTFRDRDTPGETQQVLDNESKALLWSADQPDADRAYRALTKGGRVVGRNVTSLRELYEFEGQVLEAVTPHYGEPPAQMLARDTRAVVWDAAHPDAPAQLERILATAAPLGLDAVTEFELAPPEPRAAHTTLDLLGWEATREGKLDVALTWCGHQDDAGAHDAGHAAELGTTLEAACRKRVLPRKVLFRAPNEERRDDWFKFLRASHVWAVAQLKEMKHWRLVAGEMHASGGADGAAAPLMGNILKITEDQMDHYRAKLLLIFDQSFAALSGNSKAKAARMEEFRRGVEGDIAGAVRYQESLVRVTKVLKGSARASWTEVGIESADFYLGLAKRCRQGATLVELLLEPDMHALEQQLEEEKRRRAHAQEDGADAHEALHEDGHDSTGGVRTTQQVAEEVVAQWKEDGSAIRAGLKTSRLFHAELKSDLEGVTDGASQGHPVWIEADMNGQRHKTQTLGSLNAQFNELLRFYLEPGELASAVVNFRVFTTKLFGGRRLLGRARFVLSALAPNVVSPATLPLDENEHGIIVLQAKFVPKRLIAPRKRQGVREMRTQFPLQTLRSRHQEEDPKLRQRLFELKEVLSVEANVNKDYACRYDGLDALGRVRFTGLEAFVERITDDVFSVVKQYGALQRAVERPLTMLELEARPLPKCTPRRARGRAARGCGASKKPTRAGQQVAQYRAFREQEGVLCAGRYDVLSQAQEYIMRGAPNTVMAITGPAGSGKSNIMAQLDRMFRHGRRIQVNASTGLLQLCDTPGFADKKRGASWDKPEIASIFIGLSNGNTTPRFFLHTLMSKLAYILRECTCELEPSEHTQTVPPQEPTKLLPIPNEYNVLRLQFLTLCFNVSRFVPNKKILILFDQVNDIRRMRYDWIPTVLPKNFRIVLATNADSVIQKIRASARLISVHAIEVGPMSMLARKEMVRHLLSHAQKQLSMEQTDILVQKAEAGSPDFVKIAVEALIAFDREMRTASPFLRDFAPTLDGLVNQWIDRTEEYCGATLTRECLSLISTSLYGLTEIELLMLLARTALVDAGTVKHRLPEEGATTAVAHPSTPMEERAERLALPSAFLPYGLWAPLRLMMERYMKASSPHQAPSYRAVCLKMQEAVDRRYALAAPGARILLHTRLAAYFRARADPELQSSWRSLDFRAANCLVFHMIGSKRWQAVAAVLTDIGFLELCVRLGRVYALCDDITSACTGMEAGETSSAFRAENVRLILEVQRFMHSRAELLAFHPQLLTQLMANEEAGSPVQRIAYTRLARGWEGRNWLRWRRLPGASSVNTRTMRGHRGWIRALAVTRDGRYIVSGADDRQTRFWSVDSGAVIHQLVGHREAVSCVAVSSDGILLITGSLDASVKLWDIRSGIELANLFVGSACTCCAFDAEAAHIMAGTQDSSLHIFNTKSLQERHTLLSHRLGVRACVFSADSTKVLSAGSDAKVMLWDLARLPPGRKLVEAPHAVLEAHALGCRALVWNPRLATQAASGGEDAQIVVWDLASGAAERTLSGHDGPVLALAYTPSGAYILSSSADSSVRVWEPFCSSPLFTFHAHAGPVYAVVVTVDEYRCISAGADSTLRTWDLRGLISEDPEAERLARGPQSPGADSPARLPSADGSPAAGSPARSPAGGFWAVTPPGSPGSPGSPGGKGRARGQMQFADVTSLCFSPQGDVIVSASQDTSYALRSVEDGAIIGEPRRGHALPVTCAEFHPEGRLLLTASEDQSIKLWEVQSGRLISTIRGNTATVAAARYFPDGRRAVSVSWDHSVRLWDMETSRETFRFPPHLAHASPARCVAVSPDNNVLATGGHDSFVRVWDVRQRQLVRKLIGHLGNVLSCAFSRDGASILSGSEDSTARLWNLNGYTVHKFEHHTAPVTCVDVTPSGRHFLTGSKDKHVAIYSALSLREVGRWVCESACGCVASSSRSGGIVACGDTTGITYVLKSVLSPCGEWRHF